MINKGVLNMNNRFFLQFHCNGLRKWINILCSDGSHFKPITFDSEIELEDVTDIALAYESAYKLHYDKIKEYSTWRP